MLSHHVGRYMYVGMQYMQEGGMETEWDRGRGDREKEREMERERGGESEGGRERGEREGGSKRERERDWRPWDIGCLPTCRMKLSL